MKDSRRSIFKICVEVEQMAAWSLSALMFQDSIGLQYLWL